MTQSELPNWRRALARALSVQASASADDVLAIPPALAGHAYRIGITGPPGAGKSSLIATLASLRLTSSRRVGVLAIDPTSPMSGGSLLGDRIRMDGIADQDGLFIRSVPSRTYTDGLCPNVLGMLDCFETAQFDDVILETVGVGQNNYAGRHIVDTFVLVLAPDSGDTVQAMKGGILETADIYVVNKADLGTGARLASELRSIAGWRANTNGWTPPVILLSSDDPAACAQLDAAINAHRATVAAPERTKQLVRKRRAYQLRSLLQQQLDDVLAAAEHDPDDQSLQNAYAHIIRTLTKV